MAPPTSWTRIIVGGILTGGLITGCSLLVETGDLAGGSTSTDASIVLDGRVADVAMNDGARSGSFCANQSPPHAFCTDFDDQPLAFGWTRVASDPGIAVELDPLATSAPRSVRTRVVTAKTCSYANLSTLLPGPYQSGRFAFDVRVGAEVNPTFPGAYVGYVEIGKCLHLVHVLGDKTAVYTQIDFPAGEDRRSAVVTIQPGTWRRVALDFDRADGSIQLSIDGAVVIPRTVVDARCVGAGSVKASVGLFCQADVAEARFDNVTFDGQ